MNDQSPEHPGSPAALPIIPARLGCGCCGFDPRRRRFTGRLLLGGAGAAAAGWLPAAASAREGVDVGGPSSFSQLVPAAQIEQAAALQYRQMLQQAAAKRALAPATNLQLIRLRTIAERIIPHTYEWNPRARQWNWEVNLIGSSQVNAFCMPGGKIAFFYGILQKLQLSDDEVAMIMGHEATHALREHAREQMSKQMLTRLGAGAVSAILGLGYAGDSVVRMGSQLVGLVFSRADETEADLIGLELAARAGYDPRAGVTLWQKMGRLSKSAPPPFLSTHPSGPTRIHDIEVNIPKVAGLYARADRPSQRFGPPAAAGSPPRPGG